MTCRQAYKAFGGGDAKKGKKEIEELADRIVKMYGVECDIVPFVNEEEPKDNWLNVLFEYRVAGDVDQTREFDDALEDVCGEFGRRGLSVNYECSGDGDGIIESYRVGG